MTFKEGFQMERHTVLERWFTVPAFLFALPFLIAMPLIALLGLFAKLFPRAPLGLIVTLDMPLFFVLMLLSNVTRYLAISLVALLLTLVALIWLIARERGQAWRRKRFYLLVVALMAILAFPLLMRYQPAVKAAPGVELRIVDRPDLLRGVVKSCQVATEVRGYQYEPLGWADARTLVYRRWCGGYYDVDGWRPGSSGDPQAYCLDTDTVTPFEGDVGTLSREFCSRSTCVNPRLAEVYPGGGYFPGQYEAVLISPDGRWIAFTAEHVYGPEDLLVISSE
jgi:hypothetical protein